MVTGQAIRLALMSALHTQAWPINKGEGRQ